MYLCIKLLQKMFVLLERAWYHQWSVAKEMELGNPNVKNIVFLHYYSLKYMTLAKFISSKCHFTSRFSLLSNSFTFWELHDFHVNQHVYLIISDILAFLFSQIQYFIGFNFITDIYHFKGTGTQDLIWLKVVSLDRSWLVGLTEDL